MKKLFLLPLLFIIVSCQSLKRLNPTAQELSQTIPNDNYQFIMLGDIHYDIPDIHAPNQPEKRQNAINRNLAHWQNLAPKLVAAAATKTTDDTLFAFQAGDITHGYAKSKEAQITYFQQALAAIATPFRDKKLPFFVVKGNHDFASPGKGEAYAEVVMPFNAAQLPKGSFVENGNYAFRHGKDLFVFIDCQLPDVDFIKRIINKYNDIRHLFVIDHLPVLPYCGGSPEWILFGAKQGELKSFRPEFRKLLAQHHALVLAGHVHNNSITQYLKPDEGDITQLTFSSMPASHDDFPPPSTNFQTAKIKNAMKNDKVKKMLDEFVPFYAKHQHTSDGGYAVIRVNGDNVFVDLYYADKTDKPSLTWNLTQP